VKTKSQNSNRQSTLCLFLSNVLQILITLQKIYVFQKAFRYDPWSGTLPIAEVNTLVLLLSRKKYTAILTTTCETVWFPSFQRHKSREAHRHCYEVSRMYWNVLHERFWKSDMILVQSKAQIFRKRALPITWVLSIHYKAICPIFYRTYLNVVADLINLKTSLLNFTSMLKVRLVSPYIMKQLQRFDVIIWAIRNLSFDQNVSRERLAAPFSLFLDEIICFDLAALQWHSIRLFSQFCIKGICLGCNNPAKG